MDMEETDTKAKAEATLSRRKSKGWSALSLRFPPLRARLIYSHFAVVDVACTYDVSGTLLVQLPGPLISKQHLRFRCPLAGCRNASARAPGPVVKET